MGVLIEGVKAKYSKGAIVPLEPLDIEEGASLSVSIDVHTKSDDECLNQMLDDLYIRDYFDKSGR